MPSSPSRTLPGPEYAIDVDLRAPLPFVFAWCTDYREDDAERAGERYRRKVIGRTGRRVVFEDLEEDDAGFNWSRVECDLRPPAHWHAERRGNRREVSVDYRLVPLGPERTRLEIRLRRRDLLPGVRRLPKRRREALLAREWARFRSALEHDYRAGSRAPGKAGPSARSAPARSRGRSPRKRGAGAAKRRP